MDQRLDAATNLLIQQATVNGLILWNWLSTITSALWKLSAKSFTGALNAHKSPVWVFIQRNTVPWVLLEGDVNLANTNNFPLTFYPDTQDICFANDGELINKSFGDVVLVEMTNAVNNLKIELSSTFHNIKWKGNEVVNPSLYEIALIHCLANNLLFTEAQMCEFTLNILTTDAQDIVVPLSGFLSRSPFMSWDSFAGPKIE